MEAKWSNRSARTLFRRSARWTIKSNALKPKAKKYAGVWKDIQSLSPGTLVQVQLPAQSKGEDTWCVLRSPTGFTHLGDSDVLVLVGPAPTVSEPKLHHELQSVLGIGEAEGPAANVLKSLSRQAVPWPNRAYLDLQDDADGHASLRRIIEELKSVA